jgi:CelD/BcsL family acetyltransferase involved in cellulose biosynthesis
MAAGSPVVCPSRGASRQRGVTNVKSERADARLPRPVQIEPLGPLDASDPEWNALAHESRNVFSTAEWASTWWHHRGEETSPLVFACRREGGALVAVLPLYVSNSRPVRVARFIGHGPADQLGPICAPSSRDVAARALESVAESAGVDLLLAELLPGGEGWDAVLGRAPVHVESSPIISLARGWDAYLASRSANFRQQVRRREQRLSRNHALDFRLAQDPARLQDDLDVLFALHVARWGKERSEFLRWEAFHREFAVLAFDRGWLRLWFLQLDNSPVAAWYGFRFGGVESYYQAGRDPRRSDDSVGFVLLAHTIREAARDGMSEYRLLRGAEPFKRRFADTDPGLATFALARGIRGRIAGFAALAALRSDRTRLVLRRLAAR